MTEKQAKAGGRRCKTAKVTRVLKETGTVTRVRLDLLPLPGGRVDIVKAQRKRDGEDRYRRVRAHELKGVPFERLGLRRSWDEIFQNVRLPKEA